MTAFSTIAVRTARICERFWLERQAQACGNATRRGDGSAGKKAGKVDDIHSVRQIRELNLESGAALLLPVELRAGCQIHGIIRPHASASQVHLVQDGRAVQREKKIR